MELNQLNYFRTVARLQNVTKAAAELYISQPNLSTSIARLENSLRVTLFERKSGKIRLTTSGEIFLNHVNRVFQELEAAMAEIREHREYREDTVAVAASFGGLLPVLFSRYFSDYSLLPSVQVVYPNSIIEKMLTESTLDMGIMTIPPSHPDLEWRPIFEDELVALVLPANPLAELDTAGLSAFREEHFICNELYYGRADLMSLCRNADFVPNIVRTSNEPEFFVETSLDFGNNVVICPVHFVPHLTQEGALKLKIIRLTDYFARVTIGIARPKSHGIKSVQSEFFDFAVGELHEILSEGSKAGHSLSHMDL